MSQPLVGLKAALGRGGKAVRMEVKVYAILGGGDLPVGRAHDAQTLLSPVELARLKGADGVSLHGQAGGWVLSGEMGVGEAGELALLAGGVP